VEDIHKGIFVHSVYLSEDLDEDRRATMYGNVNEQIDTVAAQLSDIPELANGFDAIGFSQGGQFLRAYIERFNTPPVHNLVTFGSPHMGISDIPPCKPLDLLCRAARNAAKRGVYSEWAQEHLVQAQYYRDPSQLDVYFASNHFLTSVNNEVEDSRNATYAKNLATLDHLVLILFSNDKTVVPKETAWFGSYSEDGDDSLVHMREHPMYTEDWIGLRELDERGAIELKTCKGEHMQLTHDCWEPLVREYTGSVV